MDTTLLHEIGEIEAKIDALSQQRKFSLNNTFLHVGLFFFLIFLFTITQSGIIFNALALLSFAVLSVTLLKSAADIFHFKSKEGFYVLLGIVLLLVIGLSYVALWTYVFVYHSLLLLIGCGIALFFMTAFYLLHAYLSYYYAKAKQESLITGGMLLTSWFFFVLSMLYSNMLTYLLLIIATLVLLKAVYDFSQRFVKKKK